MDMHINNAWSNVQASYINQFFCLVRRNIFCNLEYLAIGNSYIHQLINFILRVNHMASFQQYINLLCVQTGGGKKIKNHQRDVNCFSWEPMQESFIHYVL